MNTSKLITGTVAGTIAGFVASFIIYGFILASFMESNVSSKAEVEMVYLVLGHVFYAAMLTYIFLQWAGIKTPGTGAKAGAIIALLGGLGVNIILLGTSTLFPGGIVAAVVDALGGAVSWAIGGAAIGWVIGRGD